MLGDIHGGAVEGTMDLLYITNTELASNKNAVSDNLECFFAEGKKLPGFGHQLHDQDPRVDRLYELAQKVIDSGEITGDYLAILEEYRKTMSAVKNRTFTINVDGISAAIQCELGIPAEAAKGIFALSRGMGIVAHAYEELMQGTLIKGPCPNEEKLVKYTGDIPKDMRKE